jgi:hypothetical protein
VASKLLLGCSPTAPNSSAFSTPVSSAKDISSGALCYQWPSYQQRSL